MRTTSNALICALHKHSKPYKIVIENGGEFIGKDFEVVLELFKNCFLDNSSLFSWRKQKNWKVIVYHGKTINSDEEIDEFIEEYNHNFPHSSQIFLRIISKLFQIKHERNVKDGEIIMIFLLFINKFNFLNFELKNIYWKSNFWVKFLINELQKLLDNLKSFWFKFYESKNEKFWLFCKKKGHDFFKFPESYFRLKLFLINKNRFIFWIKKRRYSQIIDRLKSEYDRAHFRLTYVN
jgi:hypothetical protein